MSGRELDGPPRPGEEGGCGEREQKARWRPSHSQTPGLASGAEGARWDPPRLEGLAQGQCVLAHVPSPSSNPGDRAGSTGQLAPRGRGRVGEGLGGGAGHRPGQGLPVRRPSFLG